MGPNNKFIQLCRALTVVYDSLTHSPFLDFVHCPNFFIEHEVSVAGSAVAFRNVVLDTAESTKMETVPAIS